MRNVSAASPKAWHAAGNFEGALAILQKNASDAPEQRVIERCNAFGELDKLGSKDHEDHENVRRRLSNSAFSQALPWSPVECNAGLLAN
jgi:hypothetical protein